MPQIDITEKQELKSRPTGMLQVDFCLRKISVEQNIIWIKQEKYQSIYYQSRTHFFS